MKGLSVKYLIVTLLCILCWENAAGQNNVTMESGTLYIDGCQHPDGTIYDNGGYENNYTNNFIGYVVITTQPGVTINLSGSYNTEQCCDKITIYDGCDATGNILFGPSGGNNMLNVSCTTGCMTLKFTTDVSVVRLFFILQLQHRRNLPQQALQPQGQQHYRQLGGIELVGQYSFRPICDFCQRYFNHGDGHQPHGDGAFASHHLRHDLVQRGRHRQPLLQCAAEHTHQLQPHCTCRSALQIRL